LSSDVAVILPALNEIECVKQTVEDFLREGTRVVLVDNGSTDGTAEAAKKAGAEVVYENRRGYGNACLAGLSHLALRPPSIVVFADCDGTQDSSEIGNITAPVASGEADLVLGRRVQVEQGALAIHQMIGNGVVSFMLRRLYGLAVRDISPYRAVRWSLLRELRLSQTTYGFPIEMMILVAQKGGRLEEVDVAYRRRAGGRSKVSGSITASLRAGAIMVTVLISLWYRGNRN
jgi:glycosyltransferase involved in cell wall biosynthesis